MKGTFVFVTASVPFLARLAYLLKFRFKHTIAKPTGYGEAKAILTITSVVFLVIGAFILAGMGNWVIAIVLGVACLTVNYFARLYAFQRAVSECVSMMTSVPIERRREIAVHMIISDIKDGTRA